MKNILKIMLCASLIIPISTPVSFAEEVDTKELNELIEDFKQLNKQQEELNKEFIKDGDISNNGTLSENEIFRLSKESLIKAKNIVLREAENGNIILTESEIANIEYAVSSVKDNDEITKARLYMDTVDNIGLNRKEKNISIDRLNAKDEFTLESMKDVLDGDTSTTSRENTKVLEDKMDVMEGELIEESDRSTDENENEDEIINVSEDSKDSNQDKNNESSKENKEKDKKNKDTKKDKEKEDKKSDDNKEETKVDNKKDDSDKNTEDDKDRVSLFDQIFQNRTPDVDNNINNQNNSKKIVIISTSALLMALAGGIIYKKYKK